MWSIQLAKSGNSSDASGAGCVKAELDLNKTREWRKGSLLDIFMMFRKVTIQA